MITNEQAHEFAERWICDWNNHDVDAVIEHYADNVEFYSPLIGILKFNETGRITNKAELKSYFQKGLNSYPDLRFKLKKVFKGTNSIVLYYVSVKGRLAAEVFELDESNKVVKVLCNYSD
jgi:hypothetical protein